MESEKIKNKIIDIKKIKQKISKLRNNGKKIVLCHGDFDILHTGHINYFHEAKKFGDYLIVSVTAGKFINKGPGRPINDDNQRIFFLANLSIVDFVVLDENFDAVKVIQNVRPNFYVKGKDYYLRNKKDFYSKSLQKEKQTVERCGGKLIFTTNKTRSSSSIINNLFLSSEVKKRLDRIKKYYNYEKCLEDIESFKNFKILVIGETIVDRYIYTQPLSKPSKENIIAVDFEKEIYSLGGVFTAYKAFNAFSNKVDCLTLVSDSTKKIFKKADDFYKNKNTIFKSTNNIIKTRYVEKSHKKIKKLFEVYQNNFLLTEKNNEKKIIKYLNNNLKNYDLVLVNDYGHGFFTKKIIDLLIKKSKFLSVNTQINAGNRGFNLITKYKKANFYCIDEMEAMRVLSRNDLKVSSMIDELHKKVKAKYICITLGTKGSCMKPKNSKPIFFPALTNSVVDTVSAGDIFFVISSLFLMKNKLPEVSTFLGNVGGALAVNKENSSSFTSKDLFISYVDTLFK